MYVEDTYRNMINRLAEKNSTCKVICVGATLRVKKKSTKKLYDELSWFNEHLRRLWFAGQPLADCNIHPNSSNNKN